MRPIASNRIKLLSNELNKSLTFCKMQVIRICQTVFGINGEKFQVKTKQNIFNLLVVLEIFLAIFFIDFFELTDQNRQNNWNSQIICV